MNFSSHLSAVKVINKFSAAELQYHENPRLK
jgi:hypothetical protein